jgi:hypothetical protein
MICAHFLLYHCRALISPVLLVLACSTGVSARKAPVLPIIRWEEGKACCTFATGDDGKYRYSLSADDLVVTLVMDSQELQKVHRRPMAMLGVNLTLKYLGQNYVDVPRNQITLEAENHSHVILPCLNPDGLAAHLQSDMDVMNDEVAHQVEKHPETKEQQETLLQAHLKDTSEMIEFLSRNSLPSNRLDPVTREITGWVFFDTKNKWIGKWKEREKFTLRIQLEDRMLEFPFMLPPKDAGLILRRRPE